MNYYDIEKLVGGQPLPLVGINEDGESIIIQEYIEDGEHCYKVTTSQSNGWLRDNYYHEDGTVEEMYRK